MTSSLSLNCQHQTWCLVDSWPSVKGQKMNTWTPNIHERGSLLIFYYVIKWWGKWHDDWVSDLRARPEVHIYIRAHTNAFEIGEHRRPDLWNFSFLFFRSKKCTEREASPYGEKERSPEEGSRNIPGVFTRQPDIWSTLGEKRPHPHMQSYFCILSCWCLTRTTCLIHRKGKDTNIYQVLATCPQKYLSSAFLPTLCICTEHSPHMSE